MAKRRPFDHIWMLNDGRIAEQGPLEELLLRSHEMQRLWHGDVAGYEESTINDQRSMINDQ